MGKCTPYEQLYIHIYRVIYVYTCRSKREDVPVALKAPRRRAFTTVFLQTATPEEAQSATVSRLDAWGSLLTSLTVLLGSCVEILCFATASGFVSDRICLLVLDNETTFSHSRRCEELGIMSLHCLLSQPESDWGPLSWPRWVELVPLNDAFKCSVYSGELLWSQLTAQVWCECFFFF